MPWFIDVWMLLFYIWYISWVSSGHFHCGQIGLPHSTALCYILVMQSVSGNYTAFCHCLVLTRVWTPEFKTQDQPKQEKDGQPIWLITPMVPCLVHRTKIPTESTQHAYPASPLGYIRRKQFKVGVMTQQPALIRKNFLSPKITVTPIGK